MLDIFQNNARKQPDSYPNLTDMLIQLLVGTKPPKENIFTITAHCCIFISKRVNSHFIISVPYCKDKGHIYAIDRVYYLLFCKMVLAEFFPQLPVFTEHVQSWGHLTQSNNVPAIREPV